MERIKRNDYLQLVYSYLGKGEAVVLTGHRRAGKSCILELLAAELSVEGNVIYIDMENPENADLATFRELSERIKGAGVEGKHNYVLIDEVQEVDQFEKALRYWVKQDGVSEALFKVGMCLPAGPYVTDEDVKYIVDTIKANIIG